MAELFDTDTEGRRASARRRVFTLAKANQALGLVERIVRDVVSVTREAAETQRKLGSDSLSRDARRRLETEADGQERRFETYADELTAIGCELKDANTGLIDFVGRHEGRLVFLCWRLGEQGIGHWHELDAGFAGRQPVSSLRET